MRYELLHWNILDGGGSRLGGIGQLVRARAYDIVTFNELNGVSAGRLRNLGRAWGYTHSALLKKSAYHLGVLSRQPLEVVRADRSDAFAHGLLCARVVGVTLCVAHLDPHDTERRSAEAREIGAYAASVGGRFMLVGDLNTLSPHDAEAHRAADLPAVIAAGRYAKALSKKFLDRRSQAPPAAGRPVHPPSHAPSLWRAGGLLADARTARRAP